jgi:hypothetical protein
MVRTGRPKGSKCSHPRSDLGKHHPSKFGDTDNGLTKQQRYELRHPHRNHINKDPVIEWAKQVLGDKHD